MNTYIQTIILAILKLTCEHVSEIFECKNKGIPTLFQKVVIPKGHYSESNIGALFRKLVLLIYELVLLKK